MMVLTAVIGGAEEYATNTEAKTRMAIDVAASRGIYAPKAVQAEAEAAAAAAATCMVSAAIAATVVIT